MKLKAKSSVLSVLSVLAVMLAACDFNLTPDQKKELAQKVVAVLAEKGQQHASAYIDQLVAEEKITPEQAVKIKAAIPLGIEKVKEVLTKEKESDKQ